MEPQKQLVKNSISLYNSGQSYTIAAKFKVCNPSKRYPEKLREDPKNMVCLHKQLTALKGLEKASGKAILNSVAS